MSIWISHYTNLSLIMSFISITSLSKEKIHLWCVFYCFFLISWEKKNPINFSWVHLPSDIDWLKFELSKISRIRTMYAFRYIGRRKLGFYFLSCIKSQLCEENLCWNKIKRSKWAGNSLKNNSFIYFLLMLFLAVN